MVARAVAAIAPRRDPLLPTFFAPWLEEQPKPRRPSSPEELARKLDTIAALHARAR